MLYVTGTARVAQPGELHVKGDTSIGVCAVAFTHSYTNSQGNKVEETTFVDLVGFGGRGETIATRIPGELLEIQGRLSVRSNKANGTTYKNVSVIANSVGFLTTKADREELIAKRSGQPEVETRQATEEELASTPV